jgi:tetratricopeptide (TPR) repeat protein
MRKIVLCLFIASCCGLGLNSFGNFASTRLYAQEAESKEEVAEMLYEEAVALKEKGNIAEAVETYGKAIKSSRAILALDDKGLIKDLQDVYEAKVKENDKDVKALEMLGFLHAVCFSDSETAITYYEKVKNLVDDDKVKEKTQALIDRIRATSQAQEKLDEEMASAMREERLKSWSEMEKVEKFGQESAKAQADADQLADLYKEKDSLSNRVPQLEKELEELQTEYDRANRMWHTLKDDLYWRRRRRLKDDIAAKEKEVEKARTELDELDVQVGSLEKAVEATKQKEEESPVRSYEPEETTNQSSNAGGSNYENNDSAPVQPPSNDFGGPVPENTTEEPLPAATEPEDSGSEDESQESEKGKGESRLQDLINNL